MKKIFRKAITVLGSAALIGATVGVAAAAAYPAPFASNTAIVVGADAAPSDNIYGAALIAADLAQEAVGGTTTSVDGDSFYLGKGSDEFQFGYNLGSVYSDLDDGEMESFLADGDYNDGDIDSEFTQKITLGTDVSLGLFADDDYDDDKTPTIGFHFDDDLVLSYEMTISDGDENYSALEDTEIPLMGNEYYVLDATAEELILLDSAEKTIITEGETVTIAGKTVSIDYIDENTVKFSVDGESTDKLSDSATTYDKYFELDDESYIVLSENLYATKDSGVSRAEFSIGKGKITLDLAGGEVELNDDTVTGLTSNVYSDGSNAVNNVNDYIKTVNITWTTDDEKFLVPGEPLVMPGFETIKVLFNGMDFPADTEKISIDKGETVTLNMGNFDVDLVYNGTAVSMGDDGNLLHIDATEATNKTYFLKDGDRFLAVDLEDTLSEIEQLYYEVTTLQNDSNGYDLELKDLTDGGDDITFANEDADEEDTSRGDVTVKLNLVYEDGVVVSDADAVLIKAMSSSASLINETTNVTATEIAKVTVTQDDDENLQFDKVVSQDGMVIEINATTDLSGADDLLTFYEAADDGDIEETHTVETADFQVDLALDDDYVYAAKTGTDITFKEESDNVYVGYAETDLASMVTYDTDTDSYEVTYFGEEITADVQVVSGEVTTSAAGDAGVMIVMDDDASAMAGKNLIVVGGSAINSVAADLLGGAYSEGAFTDATGVGAGQFMIKSFDNAGKTTLLVAGYNYDDTQKAVTYLLNNDVDTSTVDEVMTSTVVADVA